MNKIKQFSESDRGKNILTILVVILVGLGSFGLGRLSKDAKNSGISIKYPNQEANAINSFEQEVNSYNSTQDAPKSQTQVQNTIKKSKGSTDPVGKAFFASNRGSKYYSIGCSGGKTLKPENKIYFATEAEAMSAGYKKSSTCK